MMKNIHETSLKLAVLFTYLILLLPLVGVVIVSFNPARLPTFPPVGFTVDWYIDFFQNTRLLRAFFNSFVVATGSTIVVSMIGLVTAFGFVRHNFPFKNILASVIYLPLLISPVVVGVAITAYLTTLGLQRTYLYVIVGHSTIVLPYVFITVQSQLYGMDESLEEAARTLGANELETFIEVTFPLVKPGLAAGMLLAFVISFGEFTATQFWVIPKTETVPILIYSMVRTNISPMINAMGTLLILVTILTPIILSLLTGENLFLEAIRKD